MSCCRAFSAPEALTCQVCLDSFQNPTQVFICGHIFCESCIRGATNCPTCRGHVEYTKPGPYSVAQGVLVLPVMCGSCGWQGTRQQSLAHRCGTKDTQSVYSSYPHLSDEELRRRAMNPSRGSIFDQPGTFQGIALSSEVDQTRK
ncbi:EF hand [Trypanosoma rangeli]|uniref:EF hand n=1 Tax=Trypanosoma rangeli TaxID=5698 RepID=A0A3R7KGI2_TRYRA|nr:EF hand [Trypanosoma rangeli]RNF07239.1 EF hand [Trypanosoma rangeli]|eukprot:RNF07239.1 EF hand [Trypanosoma rangeli]